MAFASTAAVRRYVVGAAVVLAWLVAVRQPRVVRPATVVVTRPDPEQARLRPVVLEPRWLDAYGYDTVAELDAALGGTVEAWQPFAYARDAGGRLAIASEPYRLGGREPAAEFVADGQGGIWRVASPSAASTGRGNWTRRIWLVPLDAAFRGDVHFP